MIEYTTIAINTTYTLKIVGEVYSKLSLYTFGKTLAMLKFIYHKLSTKVDKVECT
jgi:hypothetical protein